VDEEQMHNGVQTNPKRQEIPFELTCGGVCQKGLLWASSTIPASFTPVCLEYWNNGSESRNNYALGNEYSKGGFQVSASVGSSMEKGKELKNRIQPTIKSVQELRLPYIPCRMFKNEKFGGYVAENYRALTTLSPWIFRCLLDKEFTPALPVLPPHGL
jgi:hypothetical protein